MALRWAPAATGAPLNFWFAVSTMDESSASGVVFFPLRSSGYVAGKR